MKKWKDRFLRLNFDRKMQLVVTSVILITTVLSLVISSASSVTSMKEQSIELLQEQNTTVVKNFGNSLQNYKSLAIATVLDKGVQRFAKQRTTYRTEDSSLFEDAYNMLDSINNMHSDLNFIALIEDSGGNYVFKGKETITTTNVLRAYRQDEKICKLAQNGALKIGYNNAYYKGDQYTLNVYFPIYDTEKIFGELGLLCMCFRDPNLAQIVENTSDSNTDLFVLDTDGMMVASRQTELMGSYVDYMDALKGSSGNFTRDRKLYIYQRVAGWNYYVVSSIPTLEIYRSSINTVLIVVLILSCILLISIQVVKRVIAMVYRPLDKVVNKMDDVAAGSLKTRINVENVGEDFMKLAVGFNSMMEEIQVLMEQVKLEQHQMEEIRFNALQSQIQPHFLYNTLECIHWQAIADGNQETSTLVKALAKYYRICLSNGHDVITLNMELDHVRNYLIIQNMRYDNIIASVFDIEEGIDMTMIPKLTLQPLVENAIYHGMKVKEGKTGTLFVSAKRNGENVLITMSDTGSGMEQEKIDEMNQQLAVYDDSFGYGVRNVNKRIELLYGKEYGLHYLKNESGGVTVEILLPYTTQEKDGILRRDEIRV